MNSSDLAIPSSNMHATPERLADILRIQTVALKSIHDYLTRAGFLQLMPVILSSITDPLNHDVDESSLRYRGQKLELTKSMIFHKQIAISTLDVDGIYIISPNVRLEQIPSNRHLLEFSQVDIEMRDATGEQFRALMEEMMIRIFSDVRAHCGNELERLGASIDIPKSPFPIYSRWDLMDKFGSHFEKQASEEARTLFWITDFEREFYDREDPSMKGHYINYDLFYPFGFQEALSGGERDFEYDILIRKILERGQDPNDFAPYLDYARKGLLRPSAGGGLGVERLVRFLCNATHIREVTPFPKVVDEPVLF